MSTAANSSEDREFRKKKEMEKWDAYYASLSTGPEGAGIAQFNEEFADRISAILPEGAHILEAGCGGGYQSLALAKRKRFHVHLMDFSKEALRYARGLFDKNGLSAEFSVGDVLEPGRAEYDLVFNAGVLEHYSLDDQVKFLRGMASRSRRYVLTLVPNRLCYWYWIWRIHYAATGEWPYGKEIPLADLSKAYREAGMTFLGNAFLGSSWTEGFIEAMRGMDPSLMQQILLVHRSNIVPLPQRSFLLGSLGSVRPESPLNSGLFCVNDSMAEDHDVARLCATVSDLAAMRINAEHQLAVQNQQVENHRVVSAQLRSLLIQEKQLADTLQLESNRSFVSQEMAKRDLADCQSLLSLQAAFGQSIQEQVSQIALTRKSRRYKFGNLLWVAKRNPLSVLVRGLFWILRGTRRRQMGLMQALKAPDPLAAVQDALSKIQLESSRYPQPVQHGGRELGHVVIFGEWPDPKSSERQRGAELAKAFAQQFYRVTYISMREGERWAASSDGASLDLPGVEALFADQITPASLLARSRMSSVWIFERADQDFLPFLRLAKKCNLKTVFDLTDDWENDPSARYAFSKEVLTEFVRTCDDPLGASQGLVQQLGTLGAARPILLPNAADDSVFDPYQQFRKPTDFPAGYVRNYLCHTPRHPEWMGWAPVWQAAERNPDAAFIVQDARTPNAPPLGNLIFVGRKTAEEHRKFLAHCDAVLFSFSEARPAHSCAPSAVFEAIFMNKPVFCSRMQELEGFPNVHPMSSAEAFAESCSVAPSALQDTFGFVSRHSWHRRVDEILRRRPPNRKFSFIILNRNNQPVIGRCLETLLFHTRSVNCEVIVVDNASTDGSDRWVEEKFPDVKLIRNTKNGCSCGRNLGVAASSGDTLVFLDSDTWFTSCGFLHEADHALTENPWIGSLGWSAGWFDLSLNALGGPIVDYLPRRGANVETDRVGFRNDIAFLSTCGMFVPRTVWNCLDGFDEAYDPTCFEDTDLSFQVLREGFSIAFRDLCGICHQPHQTTRASAQSDAYMALFKRNSDYFRKKWSDHPHFFKELPSAR
jgi:GT2 family glycosyltransferase/SAM-dependent methyltransferase